MKKPILLPILTIFLCAAILFGAAMGLNGIAAKNAQEAHLTLINYKADAPIQWMLYHLFSGGLMLGAIFMATDYATSPATPVGHILYGIGCGILTVLFRYFGLFPEGVTYAILIMNAFVWCIDRHTAMRRFGTGKGAAVK